MYVISNFWLLRMDIGGSSIFVEKDNVVVVWGVFEEGFCCVYLYFVLVFVGWID